MDVFNEDFKDFILSLNKYEVKYILVGGFAVVIRGYSRSTGDMDIWVEKTEENYIKLMNAFLEFGLPTIAIPKQNFLSEDFDVFSFGIPPSSIDLITSLKGVEFNETWALATWEPIDNFKIKVIHLKHLIAAKKAANRLKDLNDIEHLPPL